MGSEGVYIQTEPDRLAIILDDSIIYIPWGRLIAFAVDREEQVEPQEDSE